MKINLSLADIRNTLQSSLLWRNSLLLLLWLTVWMLGLLVEYTQHASVWFPAAGLTFAALFIIGLRAVPVLLLACVLITLWAGHYYQLGMNVPKLIEAGLLYGIAHILPYFAGAVLLRALARIGRYSLPHFVVAFLLVAVFSALLTTFCVVWALEISGMLGADAVSSTWLPFWIGDLAGIIVIAPLFASVITSMVAQPKFSLPALVGTQHRGHSGQYLYKLLLNACLLISLLLFAHYSAAPQSAFAVFFMVIPHMWLACTESAFYNVLSITLSSFLIVLGVNLLGLMDYVMVYQFAINVIAANALFGVAVPTLTAANTQLKQIAATDSLTQVASREHLQQQAILQMAISREQAENLCLMVFDIDHFKQINDQHGHAKGDQVLLQACQIAQLTLRPLDIIGRYGGDEFVVVLPNTTIAAAVAIGERIINQLAIMDVGLSQPVSASFGVAMMHDNDSFQLLFERADAALYRAKQQGRSRVACN